MERSAPSWMYVLIILFAVTVAATIGSFLYFHGMAASTKEQLLNQREIRQDLDNKKQLLTVYEATLADPILVRQDKIEAIKAGNNEQQVTINELLLPQHSAAVGEIREAIKQQLATMNRLLAEARQAQEDLQQELDNALVADKQAIQDRETLRDQVREQSQALEKKKKDNREVVLRLEREIAQREERVQELLARQDTTNLEFTSDGQLLRAHANSGFVIIDRGHVHQLLKGTRFVVYNRRGGRNIVKGEIVVDEVQSNIAICRIVAENDANDPLIPGDHIYNRVFRPDEIKNFVVVGSFEHFNAKEISTIIEEGGGKVDDALSNRTHYLVAGDGPDAERALAQASLLGVVVLSEDQAVEFMRQPLRFAVRKGMTFVLAGDFQEVPESVIRSFIQARGGIVETSIKSGLHVLIAGSGAADDIAAARMAGAKIIGEDQLRHLVSADDN